MHPLLWVFCLFTLFSIILITYVLQVFSLCLLTESPNDESWSDEWRARTTLSPRNYAYNLFSQFRYGDTYS